MNEIKRVPDFQIGDEVWDAVVFPGQAGEVVELERYGLEVFRVRVKIPLTPEPIFYDPDGRYILKNIHFSVPTLSHTKYDLIRGGFSQRMKLPEIPKGTLMYVRDDDNAPWCMVFFSHWDPDGRPKCVRKIDGPKLISFKWKYWRLTNPYAEYEFRPQTAETDGNP